MMLRPDLAIIAREVAAGSRVLDVGCGDGALMAALRDEKQVDARGMEIDAGNVAECVARGLPVIQGDANSDLVTYPDAAFDYAILSQTRQTTARPDLVLNLGSSSWGSCRKAAQVSMGFPPVPAVVSVTSRSLVARCMPSITV